MSSQSFQSPQQAQATTPSRPCATCRHLQNLNCITEEQANACPHNYTGTPANTPATSPSTRPVANTTTGALGVNNFPTPITPTPPGPRGIITTVRGPFTPPPPPPRLRPPLNGRPPRDPIDPRTHALNPHRQGHRGPWNTQYNRRRYYGREYDPWSLAERPVEDYGEAMDDGRWREWLPAPPAPEGGRRRFVLAPVVNRGGQGVQELEVGMARMARMGLGQRQGGRDGEDGENRLPEVAAPRYTAPGEEEENTPPPEYAEVAAAASGPGRRAYPPTYDETILADIHPPQHHPTHHRPPYHPPVDQAQRPPQYQYQHQPHPDEIHLHLFNPTHPVTFDGKPRPPPGYILRNPQSRQAWYDRHEREPGLRQNARWGRCAARGMMEGRVLRVPGRLGKGKKGGGEEVPFELPSPRDGILNAEVKGGGEEELLFEATGYDDGEDGDDEA
ncbi:uncharacterized protein C8A04DRAFT_27203 [Dichotomopilus funicola]|uniref:Uncharacterized protein n=1 Tax=Dichotomopilus funicola TaxID=1934379 RepID=A0AAN6V5X7_9PEZI|nr:hypothetical protein C8A04DRAFT_27203 [Dichotomopilus funicola]